MSKVKQIHKIIGLGVLLLATLPCHTQQPLEPEYFSSDQRAEWNKFIAHWSGNGNGTCMPIMEVQISAGGCRQFGFTADLAIDKTGRIRKVKVLQSNIVCRDKTVHKELLKCFTQALQDDIGTTFFYKLSGKVIRNAAL